jgi:hypothetical protein
MDRSFYFECDFYYLYYNCTDQNHGTIYRHYTIDNKIDYIYGNNDTIPITLTDKSKSKIIKRNITKLKKNLGCRHIISNNVRYDYLQKYDYNTSHYENYYKNISLAYISRRSNFCSLVDIEMSEPVINIGMLFTFIETNKFNIDNVKIRYKLNDTDERYTETGITFETYKTFFTDDCYNEDKTIKTDCIKRKITGGTYPRITMINSEQKNINHDTIMYYFTHSHIINNMKPVIIEYDEEKNNYFIVDGNHRVAYHIINNHQYIPVLLIIKDYEIKLDNIQELTSPSPSPPSPSTKASRKNVRSPRSPQQEIQKVKKINNLIFRLT